MNRFVLTAAFVAAAAGTASADPVLDRVTSVVAKGRRIDITVEATLTAPGVLAVEGNINAAVVQFTKKVKAGHKTYKLKVDAGKYGIKSLTTGLHFDLTLSARDTASGAEAKESVTATVPVPCVVLPGFGNETTPGAFAVFATALNAAAGGVYTTTGAGPTLIVKEYPSQTKSLAVLGKSLVPVVKKALKGTLFSKVDVIGYSYGGIVARSYMSQGGGPFVRKCVFLATPNEGCPIAYAAVGLSNTGQLDQFLGQNAALAALAQQLLSPDAKLALHNLYPTYAWVTPDNFVTRAVVTGLLGSPTTPLTALNAVAPPAGTTFDAFFYTSTGAGQFGTVDLVDISALNLSGQIDPTTLATGSGDGVAPAHSVTMDDTPAWASVITKHDSGVGTHLTITADLNVLAGIATVLAQ
jgi:pimeloyl-ACP methyl ester carboxylesterase